MTQPTQEKFLFKEEVYQILGAAYEVHNILGCGFLEAIYEDALIYELGLRGIPYKSQVDLPITYKGMRLRHQYRVDLICFDAIAVELKAISATSTADHAQVLNYIRASRFDLGLLLNFGQPRLYAKRIIYDHARIEPGID